MAELCLGTAQLGMKYGINNKVGKLCKETVFEILDTAIEGNIRLWDTASIYGEAEELLGEYLVNHVNKTKNVKIISKQCRSVENLDYKALKECIYEELRQSLKRLRREYLDGYLLHSYREIDNFDTVRILQGLKKRGLVRAVGVSVYEIDEAEKAIENGMIDYLQMPCSVFDQRGLESGVFRKAKERGITIFTRSAFLQGLLMMEEDDVPEYLLSIRPHIVQFNRLLTEFNIEKRHAIVKFILSEEQIDYMVVGVETVTQLNEIIREKEMAPLPDEFVKEVKNYFCSISTDLILPINWRKNMI